MKGRLWKPWHPWQFLGLDCYEINLKGIRNRWVWGGHIPIPHGSLPWLREASSASPVTPLSHRAWVTWPQDLSWHTGTFTDQWGCWIQSDARCWEGHHLKLTWAGVTWAFSFTYAEVRAGDSASQIRQEPSDQNRMIWRDVALQHFGSTVLGLWLLLMAIVPADHIPTHCPMCSPLTVCCK